MKSPINKNPRNLSPDKNTTTPASQPKLTSEQLLERKMQQSSQDSLGAAEILSKHNANISRLAAAFGISDELRSLQSPLPTNDGLTPKIL